MRGLGSILGLACRKRYLGIQGSILALRNVSKSNPRTACRSARRPSRRPRFGGQELAGPERQQPRQSDIRQICARPCESWRRFRCSGLRGKRRGLGRGRQPPSHAGAIRPRPDQWDIAKLLRSAVPLLGLLGPQPQRCEVSDRQDTGWASGSAARKTGGARRENCSAQCHLYSKAGSPQRTSAKRARMGVSTVPLPSEPPRRNARVYQKFVDRCDTASKAYSS